MLAIFILAASIQADADLLTPPKPAETIYAALSKTVPKDTQIKNGPRWRSVPGRTYTLAELTRLFGPESYRRSSDGSPPKETFTWERPDGAAQATFAARGYLNPNKPETIKMQIMSARFERK